MIGIDGRYVYLAAPIPKGEAIACGRMPFYIGGKTNVADVRDAARGFVLLAEQGRVGER